MKENEKKRICPICGKVYYDYPALSRKDNETEICPECGVEEALEAAGISRYYIRRMPEEENGSGEK